MKIFRNGHYPRRGEIYYITEGNSMPTGSEIWPNRHALIVSANHINKFSNVVQVVYITTRNKTNSPVHVDISTPALHRTILCEQITPIDKSRIIEYKGKLSEAQMKKVDKSLLWTLNLFPYIRTNRIDNMHANML